jgi:hypothetical protein
MAKIRCLILDDAQLPEIRDRLILYGPLIPIDIGFDPDHDETTPGLIPKGQEKGLVALIDTGSATNYIDATVAKRLGLPEINKDTVVGPIGGPQEITSYLAQIHIPSIPFMITGEFGGLDLISSGMGYSALLGREFLMHFSMSYDGLAGEVFLSGPYSR